MRDMGEKMVASHRTYRLQRFDYVTSALCAVYEREKSIVVQRPQFSTNLN